ncbi:uncharacterized protein LOC120294434 [Eucalyptus grandis]|uniref:uncharacterized protein LOC120294434 n=1 Tax=Eucalyptus grandis TaxID=71139 RepID=UPI00192F1102|nr:uncharacterized protein LOC120294434 [Eucalyptus grandis]
MIVQESSQDVSSSSSQEESSDDDLPKVDERVSKPSNHMTERLQDHLADMLEASPLPVGPKKPAKGAKTSRKRGVLGPLRRAEVRRFVAVNKLCYIDLLETKVPEDNFESISFTLIRGWSWVANYSCSPRGRIWVGWNPELVSFLPISITDQAIHGCLKCNDSGITCSVSAIYGEHTFVRRRPLWADLQHYNEIFQDTAWVVGGDFNAIKDPSDRVGSSTNWIPCFDEFAQCLEQTDLADLRFVGLRYTWSTSAAGNSRKMRKIDRVLVNSKWNEDFSFSEATFLSPGISDHSPAIVKVIHPPRTLKPFKYFHFWEDHPDFKSIVSQAWSTLVYGVPMFQLVSKLKLVKARLKLLNREEFSRSRGRVSRQERTLVPFRPDLQADPLNLHLAEREMVFINFFSNLLSPHETFSKPSCEELKSYIRRPLNEEQIAACNVPVSDDEIKSTVFSLAKEKAPGPDGFSVEFFKSNWEIVGPLVLLAVRDFFQYGRMLKEVNATILTLVPKISNASAVSDFRPIACCNTIYKVITKILANRIAGVLHDVVSRSQNAFVKGMRIRDNILIAQELFAGFHLHPYLPKCAVKVDFHKAYDTVDWDFLEKVLLAFEFPVELTRLVMACVRSPSYSIAINGELHGFFRGGHGLAGGDPMSPYLFTLVMEVFSEC